MKKITVFTTTYNRANLLPRLYNSLCEQTNLNFIWLIIDDGSSDNTKELVEKWIEEDKIEIQYQYKVNGGMHTGHNLAYKLIKTELNMCIDSDDYMPKDAIELVYNKWNIIPNKKNIAGIIGLDADKDGEIIGTKIPENLITGSYYDLYRKHGVKGDKKLVARTDVIRKYFPYPEYEGEKLVPLGILYIMIGKEYDYVYSNDVFCIVEYQEEGSSNSIFKQYKQSPRGFAYARKIKLKFDKSFKDQFRVYTHLISSSFFAKDLSLAFEGVNPIKSVLIMPFGILLHFYILLKIKLS